jgi:hypothetical protein
MDLLRGPPTPPPGLHPRPTYPPFGILGCARHHSNTGSLITARVCVVLPAARICTVPMHAVLSSAGSGRCCWRCRATTASLGQRPGTVTRRAETPSTHCHIGKSNGRRSARADPVLTQRDWSCNLLLLFLNHVGPPDRGLCALRGLPSREPQEKCAIVSPGWPACGRRAAAKARRHRTEACDTPRVGPHASGHRS